MRKQLAIAAMMLSTSAIAADSNNFQMRDAADLVKVCSVDAADPAHANAMGFCHGVLVGAVRYYDSAVTGSKRFVCAPNPTPTRAKVMNDFVAWSSTHPAYMKEGAVDTLFRYLAEAYPCKK